MSKVDIPYGRLFVPTGVPGEPYDVYSEVVQLGPGAQKHRLVASCVDVMSIFPIARLWFGTNDVTAESVVHGMVIAPTWEPYFGQLKTKARWTEPPAPSGDVLTSTNVPKDVMTKNGWSDPAPLSTAIIREAIFLLGSGQHEGLIEAAKRVVRERDELIERIENMNNDALERSERD